MSLKNLEDVADVEIDPSGRFKYILVKVMDSHDKSNNKFIVRGSSSAEYHADIFDQLKSTVQPLEGQKKPPLLFDCVGGGRIEHKPEVKTIHVFGYSQGYGIANHQTSVELIMEKYPDYKVTWSNDGY